MFVKVEQSLTDDSQKDPKELFAKISKKISFSISLVTSSNYVFVHNIRWRWTSKITQQLQEIQNQIEVKMFMKKTLKEIVM